MDQEGETPVFYYAFNSKGTRVIAGPFKTRAEAKPYSRKVGMACRFLGACSGGNTACYKCIVMCFENQGKEEGK